MKRLAGLTSAAGLVFTVACAQTDAGITTAVKSKLAADDTVKAYQVNVTTDNKVVTLEGEVDSAAAETMAIQIARDTDGVRDARSRGRRRRDQEGRAGGRKGREEDRCRGEGRGHGRRSR
jgi:hypothetical protein